MGFFYAVARGRQVGVFGTWDDCKPHVLNFHEARYKKFKTYSEAVEFIEQNRDSVSRSSTSYSSSMGNRVPAQRIAPSVAAMRGVKRRRDEDCPRPDLILNEGFVVVYTDGACSANGSSRGKAGIGVWWGENHSLNLSEPVYGTRATNNTAEIQAAIRAIEVAKEQSIRKLMICTDSMFLINCMTSWIRSWKRNGWRTSRSEEVINRSDLEILDNLISDDRDFEVRWKHVPGHAGVRGNEGADQLARQGAASYSSRM